MCRGESARSWSLATSLVAPASAAAIDDSSMHSSLAASDSATGIGGGKHTQEWVTQEEWRRQYDLDAGYVVSCFVLISWSISLQAALVCRQSKLG